MQIVFHTTMRTHTVSAIFAILLCLLITPALSRAEVSSVPLSSIAANNALQSQGLQISAASIAAMMKPMRYKKEILFGEIFSSRESKIDGIFSSGKSIEVFSSAEVQLLSVEISNMAGMLKPRQAIAFKSELGRIKGYVFFTGQQSIWYFASIEGRPAEQTKKIEDDSYFLDDPEADSVWRNKVEKSYWQLKPQQSQSLYQDRPDWLRVVVKHVSTARPKRVAPPQQPVPTPVVRKKAAAAPVGQSTADQARWMRIQRLQKLLSRELITGAEYDAKMISIITEYNQSHPSIEDQLVFLKQLRDKRQISQSIYQPRRQELLIKL